MIKRIHALHVVLDTGREPTFVINASGIDFVALLDELEEVQIHFGHYIHRLAERGGTNVEVSEENMAKLWPVWVPALMLLRFEIQKIILGELETGIIFAEAS